MGKTLIQQARGKGGPGYRALSFRYKGVAKLPSISEQRQGVITDIVKCPGHLAPLAEISYTDGTTCLMQAPEGVFVGQQIIHGTGASIESGNALSLQEIPEGTLIYNIEGVPGDGGKYCRTSGTAARLIAKTLTTATVILPSRKERQFPIACRAIIGTVAGGGRKEKPFLKAGIKHFFKRSRNKRWPNPSAAAQNAVDHPFGNKRTSRKAKQRPVGHNAPPGRKVGKLWPRRTGRKK